MSDIQRVELSIETAKAAIQRAEQARRLSENKDFQDLVMDGYFVNEAARLTHLLGDATLADSQQYIMQDLHGVASFKRYLSLIVKFGDLAQNEVYQHEATLDELRAEEAVNG